MWTQKRRAAKQANGEIAAAFFFFFCYVKQASLLEDNLPKHSFYIMCDTKFVPLFSSSVKQVT